MKRFKFLLPLLLIFVLAGCYEEQTLEDGKTYQCIGVFDAPNPNINYRVSTWNVVVAVIFAETIIVPVVTVLDQVKCPTSLKPVLKTEPAVRSAP